MHIEGREAATQYAMAWLRAFPDARLTVKNELVAGDWVAQEFTFEGDHEDTLSSPSGDVPATHKRLTGRAVQLFRVEGDTIAETHLYFDQVQVMTQLGLMPEAATDHGLSASRMGARLDGRAPLGLRNMRSVANASLPASAQVAEPTGN